MVKQSLESFVRARLREWTKALTHQSIADYFHVNRSSISKLLSDDGPALTIAHLEGFAFLVQRTPAEMCALPGSLWQEIKPDEAQLLTHFRQLTYTQKQGLLAVLEGRLAQPAKARRAKPGRVELTDEQQALVDLFAESEPQARDGVMKILRGTAERSRQTGRRSPSSDRDE